MNHEQYFQQLAESNVDIKDYLKGDESEFFESLSNIKSPAFMLHTSNFSLQDNGADQCFKNKICGFTIIKLAKDKTNFALLEQIFQECEAIGDEFINKIKSDKRNLNHKFLRSFNLSSVTGEKIMNSTGYCGVQYTFQIGATHSTEVNPAKWINP
ncbi:MAG: hypothetical protein JXB49_37170, partial [Bacteroidales bacterium]|nr:hypothetical protein [Bacteroidales bacterium]